MTGLIPYWVYMFRVMAFNAQGEGEPLESKVPMMAKSSREPPEQPDTPRYPIQSISHLHRQIT